MKLTESEKERRRALNKKILKIFAWVIGVPAGLVLLLAILGNPSSQAPISQALDYEVIEAESWGNLGRKAGEIAIFSNAQTFDERAHTTMKAAIDYLESKNLEYVRAFHLPYKDKKLIGKGSIVARAAYAPDGGGTDGNSVLRHGQWEASAYKGNRKIKRTTTESYALSDISE